MAGTSSESETVPLSPHFKRTLALSFLDALIAYRQKSSPESIISRLRITNERLEEINASLEKEVGKTK